MLAIDQIADERIEKPAVVKAVTLEVDVIGAQKLSLAASVGNLSLMLRKAGEVSAEYARRITLSDLGTPSTPTAQRKGGRGHDHDRRDAGVDAAGIQRADRGHECARGQRWGPVAARSDQLKFGDSEPKGGEVEVTACGTRSERQQVPAGSDRSQKAERTPDGSRFAAVCWSRR